ncbi:MAG: NAD(P)H-dependent glycerol-3-phosphate dehydrogenase [Candidatus Omnitrophota bacterium]
MKISVIGDGGWGTALAILLAKNKQKVRLWGAFGDYVKMLNKKRENIKFLPGVKIPKSIEISADLAYVCIDAELIILAVPSQFMRIILKKISDYTTADMKFLSVAKGIEYKTLQCMSDVIYEEISRKIRQENQSGKKRKEVNLAVLSGPNIAYEVARNIPSACVCASNNKKLAQAVQNILISPTFRVYTSNDVLGVELAGALKNIIAIACGISDGLGFGANTKAALLTRGLNEISSLGIAMGAKYKTFSGLSGIGDLVTTCFSLKSRNRWLGEQLGKGKTLINALKGTEMVMEGVITTKTALKLADKYSVTMPITYEVSRVLFHKKNPVDALNSLMLREKKQE